MFYPPSQLRRPPLPDSEPFPLPKGGYPVMFYVPWQPPRPPFPNPMPDPLPDPRPSPQPEPLRW